MLYEDYDFMLFFLNSLSEFSIKIKDNPKVSENYKKRLLKFNKILMSKVYKLLSKNQRGGGIFDFVKTMVTSKIAGTTNLVGNLAGITESIAKNQIQSVAQNSIDTITQVINTSKDKAGFIVNHMDCNKELLMECLSVTVPASAPLVAACLATGVETLGAGCAPALAELGGSAAICMTKNCKPKLF